MLSGQVDKLSKNAVQKIEESTENMIKVTTKKLEDKTSDVTAVSYRQIEQQTDKIAQETVQFIQYDLDNKTKILTEALQEAEKTKKALEFQLKMKALEVEAVLDTAEETRKKIEELTQEKEKETEEQIVNRLMHKHNIRPTEQELKDSKMGNDLSGLERRILSSNSLCLFLKNLSLSLVFAEVFLFANFSCLLTESKSRSLSSDSVSIKVVD